MLTSDQSGLEATRSGGSDSNTMSIQEGPQRAPSPVPIKPEAKPRPEIPPKPSLQPSTSPPPDHSGSITATSEGKVKSIVNKFRQQEQSEQADQAPDDVGELNSLKRFKKPPVIRPKPRRASFPMQPVDQQAPPLPMKRSRRPKESESAREEEALSVKCGRSGELAIDVKVLRFVGH